jgi:hypothetical protein
MNKTRTEILNFVASKTLLAKWAIALGLIAATTFVPFLRQQLIVGPLVNAFLFISAEILSIEAAIWVCLIPSLVSLGVGLLPPLLAPLVPFIMTGNLILVLVFSRLKRKNYWRGAILASLLKFIFLYASTLFIARGLIKKEIMAQAIAMMSWPQLVTALAGSFIAWFVLSKIKLPD